MKVVIADHSGPATWFKGVLKKEKVGAVFEALRDAITDEFSVECNGMPTDRERVNYMESIYMEGNLHSISCDLRGEKSNTVTIKRITGGEFDGDFELSHHFGYDYPPDMLPSLSKAEIGFEGNEYGESKIKAKNRTHDITVDFLRKLRDSNADI